MQEQEELLTQANRHKLTRIDEVCKVIDDYFPKVEVTSNAEQAEQLRKKMQSNNELFQLAKKKLAIKVCSKDVMAAGLPEVTE